MSRLVDRETGEIVQLLDEAAARALTERIKATAEGLFELAVEAYHGQVWIALGYASWDEYLSGELGGIRLKLPREERAEVVASLREQGMSLRAIASVAGVDHETVRNDLGSGVEYSTPEQPGRITGEDGKSYPATATEPGPPPLGPKPRMRPTPPNGEIVRRSVVGIAGLADGLTYVDPANASPDEIQTWIKDLNPQLARLRKTVNRWKEHL